MRFQQRIKENTGVLMTTGLPGYDHEDGLRFDDAHHLHTMMEPMAIFLIDFYKNMGRPLRNYLDVGSGAGSLGYFLKLHSPSTNVFTIDGNIETINSPYVDKDKHFIVRTDKNYEIVNQDNKIVQFDLITSFEHLEHIQEKNFIQFLKNVKKHSHQQTLFIATAASWYHEEEGKEHVHCNVKDMFEWREYFASLKEQKLNIFNGVDCYEFAPAVLALASGMIQHGYLKNDHLTELFSSKVAMMKDHKALREHIRDVILSTQTPENRKKVNIPDFVLELLMYLFIYGPGLPGTTEPWAHRLAASVAMIMYN